MPAVLPVKATAKAVDTADRKVCLHSAIRIALESMVDIYGPTPTSVIVINLNKLG